MCHPKSHRRESKPCGARRSRPAISRPALYRPFPFLPRSTRTRTSAVGYDIHVGGWFGAFGLQIVVLVHCQRWRLFAADDVTAGCGGFPPRVGRTQYRREGRSVHLRVVQPTVNCEGNKMSHDVKKTRATQEQNAQPDVIV